MLVIALIIAGILLRFAPHAPNFTPVAAIALFSGAYLPKKYSVLVPLALMIISDVIIGMHNVVFFTWGAFALIALLGSYLKDRRSLSGMLGFSVVSALLFYAVTNFGVWCMGWYPRTLAGLLDCYILGLPFLRFFMVATVVYAAVFFGLYELVRRYVQETKLARVLLTK